MLKAWMILATAVAANYCCFYIFFCLAIFYGYLLFTDKEFRSVFLQNNSIRIHGLIIISVCAISILNLLTIEKAGDLKYGGDHSVFETISSLITCSAYGFIQPALAILLSKIFTLGLILSTAYKLYQYLLRGKCSPSTLFGFLIIATFSIFLTLHELKGTPFLSNRTALVLYPVFILFLLFAADNVSMPGRKKIIALACIGLTMLAIANFCHALNANYFYEWRDSADASVQLRDINQAVGEKNNEVRPTVFLHSIYGVFINYYSFLEPDKYLFHPLKRIDWHPLDPEYIFPRSDFALLDVDFWKVNERMQNGKYRVLKNYPVSGSVLVERIR